MLTLVSGTPNSFTEKHSIQPEQSAQVDIVNRVSQELKINVGDVLSALHEARFFGSSKPTFTSLIAARARLFELNEFSLSKQYEPGSMGYRRVSGQEEETVILKKFGAPTKLITHRSSNAMCADFEYKPAKKGLPFFIPKRLYVPYGYWTQFDGSVVLFSRDYFPLWRIRQGRTPERIFPWLRISFVSQDWYWKDTDSPWENSICFEKQLKLLDSFGVRSTPILVEILPVIVFTNRIEKFSESGTVMRELMGVDEDQVA